MKIRTDFVTNSSSSSFVISMKDKEIDFKQYLKGVDKALADALVSVCNSALVLGDGSGDSESTSEAVIISEKSKLEDYFKEYYGDDFEERMKEDEYLKSLYKKCQKELDGGRSLLFKEVSHHDSTTNAIIEALVALPNKDFTIIDSE